jgi:hypothetical protein
MDEMAIAIVGAAAAVTVLGKGLRPMAKLAMRGVVTVTDATSAGRRELQDLYTEVRTEREQRAAPDASPDRGQEPPQESVPTPVTG